MDFYVVDKARGIPVNQNKGILRFSCDEIYEMIGKHNGPVAFHHKKLIADGYVDIAHVTGLEDATELNSIFPLYDCKYG